MPNAVYALAAALVAYWIALAAGVGGEWVSHGMYILLEAAGTALVAARATRSREDRGAWALVATALGVWALGSTWSVAADLRGVSVSIPSPSDALWLAHYPVMFAGLVLLAAGRVRRPPPSVGLDALMVVFVTSALVTVTVLPTAFDRMNPLSALAETVNLAYPVLDSVLLAALVVLAVLTGRRAGGVWIVLAAGAVALATADILWAVQASAGTWAPIMSSVALYPAWPCLVAAAAWWPAHWREPVDVRDGDARILGAALVAVLVAIALLVLNHFVRLPTTTVALAALGLLAAINRTALALAESLRRSRAEVRDRALVAEVREALRAGDLTLHFQPLVDAQSGAVRGAEALLRWKRDGGFTPPDRFLPAVERSDLIADLTDHVVDRALAELAVWRAAGHDVGVSVNLAAANLSDHGLPGRVGEALALYDVPPGALTLEVTETAAVDDSEAADRVMAGLDALGVELSIDDFGTGHSSLARLARFPIDEVKVDRSFVAELESAVRPIVATTIQLAHTLGLRVVAEGIEDVGTLNALRGMGCDVAQGYFVSRPLPRTEFRAWLESRTVEPADEAVDARVVRALLGELVDELDMDAAFVAEFVDGQQAVRAFTGSETFGELREATSFPLHASYCDRVVKGVFPNIIANAREDERTREMAATREQRLGAYIGVPLHRPDGELFGTLCCVSHAAQPGLAARQLRVMRRAAETLRPLLATANLTVARRDNGRPAG